MHVRSEAVAMATTLLQQISTFVLIIAAFGMVGLSLGSLFGALPWLQLTAGLGETVLPAAGMWVQIGATVLVLALLGFLPSNARVRKLEVTSRDFQISMSDVARAYDAVHRADRDGAFELSREFDAMRDRIAWMREHPDLAELEPDILELAAQMSVESRDLASIYSSAKVERAHRFLRSRQQEVEDYRQRISMAQATVLEIRRWMQAIEVEEGLAEKQLERLQRDLDEITETLEIIEEPVAENVVQIERPKPAQKSKTKAKTPRPAAKPEVPRPLQEGMRSMLTSADEEADADLEILFKR
jgi:hypothetical protein